MCFCDPSLRTPFCGRGFCTPPKQKSVWLHSDAQSETLVKLIFETCAKIENHRSTSNILTHLMTEVGELAQETIIADGQSYKGPGEDGIVGEAIDVIICAVDMVHHQHPNITEEELMNLCRLKLAKWKKFAPKDMRLKNANAMS